VVGVLVQAQVGHDDEVLADLAHQVGDRELHDTGRVVRARPAGVLHRRDAEHDQPADAGLRRLGRGPQHRVP